ncbi:hypothetical protein Tco_0772390 [Tanacetum coccineum]|uniref:Uncharacterized protein n=1 Tax=Tanacetum coccineum TaxID=301880 RepID=A0ABQ4ZHT3_9ASTR
MDRCPREVCDINVIETVFGIPLEGDENTQTVNDTTQQQIEFRIDLVHGATPVSKSLYRLEPSEIQEFFEQLQELQDEVSIGLTEEGEVVYLPTLEYQKYGVNAEQEEAF